jgi:hypothetical protein
VTKLTLSVEEAVVENAKQLARRNKTSVSALFSQFVQSLTSPRGTVAKIGPLTRKLSGVVELPSGKDYKELLAEALMDKYGTAK